MHIIQTIYTNTFIIEIITVVCNMFRFIASLIVIVSNVAKVIICFLSNSMFTKYPDVQKKYFPSMPLSDKSTTSKLRIHGSRVVREIGKMIGYVQAGDDAALGAKIKEVKQTI